MAQVTGTAARKADHIRINLEEDVRSGLTTGLERYRFTHQALPELNLAEVNTRVTWFGKTLAAPLLISSMTGGTESAAAINRTLAAAAQAAGIAMGLPTFCCSPTWARCNSTMAMGLTSAGARWT